MGVPETGNGRPGLHEFRFSAVFKKTFWNVYDHLGKLMLVSLASIALSLTFVGLPLGVAGLGSLAARIASYKDTDLGDFLRLGLQRYRLGLVLAACLFGGSLVILSSLLFYGQDRLGVPLVSLFLLGATLWIALGFFTWLSLLFPLAFFLNLPFRELVRTSLTLLFANPGRCLVHLFLQASIWLFGLATGIGVLLFSPSFSAVFGATFARELLGQYREGLVRDGEEVRGLGDLFRPWQL